MRAALATAERKQSIKLTCLLPFCARNYGGSTVNEHLNQHAYICSSWQAPKPRRQKNLSKGGLIKLTNHVGQLWVFKPKLVPNVVSTH